VNWTEEAERGLRNLLRGDGNGKNGDGEALEALRAYVHAGFKAKLRGSNAGAADDLAHELLIKWKYSSEIEEWPDKPKPWVDRAIRNSFIDYLRRRARAHEITGSGIDEPEVKNRPGTTSSGIEDSVWHTLTDPGAHIEDQREAIHRVLRIHTGRSDHPDEILAIAILRMRGWSWQRIGALDKQKGDTIMHRWKRYWEHSLKKPPRGT